MELAVPGTPSDVCRLIIRTSFGLSLMFMGIAHYVDIQSFTLIVGDGFEGFTLFSLPAHLWAYLHPALLMFGGALFVLNRFPVMAAWAAGLPLAMIPAGMLSKTIFALDLNDMMPAAINAWIWILVYIYVVNNCLGEQKEHHHAHLQMPHLPTHMG